MKYTNEIEIDKPIARVVELMDNPDNLKHWMEGLQTYEPLTGELGEPGSTAKMVFKQGKRNIEMVETVIKNDLPSEMELTYDTKGAFNRILIRFEDLGNGRTKYWQQSEFEFEGFMMKLMAKLMPGAFRKQSMKYLKAFRDFAESQP